MPARSSPAPSRSAHNLPLVITSFVGREQELAEVRCLLGQHRLVTLTGAGASNGVYLPPFRLVSLILLVGVFGLWAVVAIRHPSTRPATAIPLAIVLPLAALALRTMEAPMRAPRAASEA